MIHVDPSYIYMQFYPVSMSVQVQGIFQKQENKIAYFKVKLSWTRGSFFVFAPKGFGQRHNILNTIHASKKHCRTALQGCFYPCTENVHRCIVAFWGWFRMAIHKKIHLI